MNGKSSDIVIGIDFGTTYSGVSWAYPGRKEIRLITDWPNPRIKIANHEKVPSTISYHNGVVERWGYSNTERDETFKWFKILLEPNHKYHNEVQEVKNASKLMKSLNKEPEQVVADYLKILWEYTMEDIRKDRGDDNWKRDYALKVVITVPAMWSHSAKDKTKKAAILAGMPDNITMIPEPEAAALSVMRDKSDEDDLGVDDTFIVCDAGGGTVDLISYTVNKVMPLTVEETAQGEGGLCGSVFLNIGFQNYIETIVGKDQFKDLTQPAKRSMITEFDQSVKRIFNPEQADQVLSIDLFGVEDDPANGIENDIVVLKKTALQSIFDHVVVQIETLISSQVAQIRAKGKKVKAILLVGGFGESSYLYDRIEKTFKPEAIPLQRAQGAWSAICRGATLAGLEGIKGAIARAPKVKSRILRHSYGFPVSLPFKEGVHEVQDKYLDTAEGIYLARGQMRWLLKVGDSVENDRVVEDSIYESVQCGFWDTGEQDFTTTLYCSEDTIPPVRQIHSVGELCTVHYAVSKSKLYMEDSFKSPITGEKWRNATFTMLIMTRRTGLDFAVQYKKEVVGSVEAQYKENF